MDKIYRKIFCGTLLGYVQLHLCPGRSSSLCQVHPIHNLELLPASTCVYYMCQHVCILHMLAHVYTTRASTCIYYTCQHVCIVHVLARVFITCARLLFKNMRPGQVLETLPCLKKGEICFAQKCIVFVLLQSDRVEKVRK